MRTPDVPSLRRWLVERVADRLGLPRDAIDIARPLDEYGLESRAAVEIAGELEELLDRAIEATVLYRFPTISALAQHLVDPEAEPERGADVQPEPREPVAVIGVGCRFPGSRDGPDGFWELLVGGVDAVHDLPPGRWDRWAQEDPEVAAVLRRTTSRGGFLDDIAGFDAAAFGMSPREAMAADPQQRMVLEVAWEALEHAGVPPRALSGTRTGVFVGASSADFGQLQTADLARIDAWTGTGSSPSIIANRLSYVLGLQGPSLVVDTACSSSLVALHLALRSLQSGESDVALAGGVNLLLSPAITVNFDEAGVMAADGRCKTFDAAADGYGRGEGCGMVVLRRLSDALRDGDRVLAVVLGSALNSDGASNGLMAPNPRAQEDVLRAAYADAGVEPATIAYVEAHGTGTALGDPIEVGALGAVLGRDRAEGQACLLGSVKTNVGHLEAAAGVAGLIKVVLSLHRGEVPPSLHFQVPNPYIDFERLHMRVVTRRTPWPADGHVRRAGVSSFGFGGTNAHAVLEEAPASAPLAIGEQDGADGRRRLYLLSSETPEGLHASAHRLAGWLTGTGADTALRDVGYTLARRRSHGRARVAVAARGRAELVERLGACARGQAGTGVWEGSAGARRDPVWVFSGQGSQWAGMGRELLATEPAFARALDELEPLVLAESGFSLRGALSEDAEGLTGVDRVQPVLFAMQVGLAAVWRSYGIEPGALIGHSMGEAAAAVVAGALQPVDGVRVICRRSRLLTRVAGQGLMALLEVPAAEVEDLLTAQGLTEEVNVAVVAGPSSTVVSGQAGTVEHLVRELDAQGAGARLVLVDVASHSPQMDELLGELIEELGDVDPAPPDVAVYSTVDDPRQAPLMDAAYWARNLRAPVRLADAVRAAAQDGHTTFVEVSPHPVLARAVLDTLVDAGVSDPLVVPTSRREIGEQEALLAGVAALHTRGCQPDLARLHPVGALVDLPTTAWNRQRYWPIPQRRATMVPADPGHPLLGRHVPLAEPPGSHVWQGALHAGVDPWLADHLVQDTAVVPAAAYCELALAAGREAGMDEPVVHDLVAHAPMFVGSESIELQTMLRLDAGGRVGSLEVYGRNGGGWVRYASARLHDDPVDGHPRRGTAVPGEALEPMDVDGFYAQLAAHGLRYGPSFRVLRRLSVAEGVALAEVALPDELHGVEHHHVHPALLDGCFQAIAAALPPSAHEGGLRVLAGLDHLAMRPTSGPLTVRAAVELSGSTATASLVMESGGEPVGHARGIRIQQVPTPSADEGVPADWVHRLAWHAAPATDDPTPPVGVTLVIADRGGVAAAVARLLQERAAPCRIVAPEQFGQTPLDGVGTVLYCPALDLQGEDGWDPAAAEALTNAAVSVVRRLSGDESDGPRLWLVTRCSQAVRDETTLNVAQATLWGLGRCIALEHPDRWGGLIELDASDAATCARHLVQEVAGGGAEGQAAYRGGERLVPLLERVALPPRQQGAVDPEGSHLVVGATGRIGPHLLRRLAGLGAHHLVLVTRRGLEGPCAELVDQLRERGTSVTDVAADVADEEAMVALFGRFGADLPPLRGVYQAAFVEDVTFIEHLQADRVAAMFRPKVRGTTLLHRLSAGHDVTEFLVFSSTTGLLGSQGLAHYAAASCFVDGLAHARRLSGLPAHVVNWGTWKDGLADSPLRAVVESSGMRLMEGHRAIRALDHVLGGGLTQIVVADVDWELLAAAYGTRTTPAIVARLAAEAAAPTRAGAEEDGAPLVEQVRAVVAEVLRLPSANALDVRRDLFEMGVDSLMSIKMLRTLKATLAIETLNPQVLLSNRTVEDLAAHLATLLPARVTDGART